MRKPKTIPSVENMVQTTPRKTADIPFVKAVMPNVKGMPARKPRTPASKAGVFAEIDAAIIKRMNDLVTSAPPSWEGLRMLAEARMAVLGILKA